jgi:large repetitive protein
MKQLTLIVIFLFFIWNSKAQCPTGNVTYVEDINCATALANLTVQVSGLTPPLSYTWTSAVSTGSVATNLGNGQYVINILDANNCPALGAYNVNLSGLFAINFTSSNLTKSVSCFGGNDGVISATVTGSKATPPISYTWSTGSNSNSISALSAGIYTLGVTNGAGCTISSTYQVQQPQLLNSSISASITCFGGSIIAPITTTGGIGTNMSYSVNNTAISGNTISGFTAGIYTLTTKDQNNCIRQNTLSFNQPAEPVFNFNISAPSCPYSQNGSVNVTLSNLALPINGYTWQPVAASAPSITNVSAGIFTVSVKDSKNCTHSKTVSVVPLSNMQTGNMQTKPETCSAADGAATVQITGGIAPLTYFLNSKPPQGSNIFSNLSSGIQTLTIQDAGTCTFVTTFSVGNTSSVQVSVASFTPVKCYNNCDGSLILNISNAVSPVSYSLSGLPAFNSNTITGVCSGTYIVKATDNLGCYATTTISYASPPAYSYSAFGSTQICTGKTAILSAQVNGGTAPYNFVWLPGPINGSLAAVSPASSVIYSLNVFDANGCTLQSNTVSIDVLPPINVFISQQNTGICPGTTAQITPSVSGGDGLYTYLWQPGNTTGASIYIQNLNQSTYTLTVSDACGSPTVTKVIELQMFPVTVPEFSVSVAEGCRPLCVSFVNLTPGAEDIYWNFGDSPFEENNMQPVHCYTTAGQFSVKVNLKDQNGCRFSKTEQKRITVWPNATPQFITKPETLYDNTGSGEIISTSGNVVMQHWYINGVSYGNTPNLNLQFNDTACMNVKLITSNIHGCTDSLERNICIKPGFTFYMPNSFKPDNDRLNDLIFPKGNAWSKENYLFRIYNRWGQLFFKTSDIHEGWDGLINNKPAPNDTYLYEIQLKDVYGDSHEFKGHINLIR